ncbi:MAG: hypothetical protein H7A35_06360 [Planctomycetales bacterium]|nr:hypothetical protein [bacterium]UNM09682.1 MAG: hypothetical protein H7A35_06360 [Planctomycetales bacterium]
MSQDPWKKAYRNSRSQRKADGGKPARRKKAHSVQLGFIFIVALPFIVGIGLVWYAWQHRGSLLPEYQEQIPQPVAERIDIPHRQVDLRLLDDGLGIGLRVFGSQGEVLRTTREWGVEWKLTALGSDRARLDTDGLRITAAGDVIESYELELDTIYNDEKWDPWVADLREANVEQQLNLREVQGDAELPKGKTIIELTGPTSLQYSGNWRHPAYELEFVDGWLEELRAGMAIGTATEGEDVTGQDG